MEKKIATGENPKKANALRKRLANAINKKANVFSAILAIIIIVMCVCLVNPEGCQYEEVLNLRWQMSWRVGTNHIASDELLAGHEQCLQSLETLKEASRLGEFIVKCDQTIGGLIINWFIVYGTRLMVMYLACHVVLQLLRLVRGFFKKSHKNNPKPQGQ